MVRDMLVLVLFFYLFFLMGLFYYFFILGFDFFNKYDGIFSVENNIFYFKDLDENIVFFVDINTGFVCVYKIINI